MRSLVARENPDDTTECTVSNKRLRCESLQLASPMLRRLEDRIRELCGEAIAAQETESDPILSKLRSALHEHSERLRKLAAARLVSAENGHRLERRSL